MFERTLFAITLYVSVLLVIKVDPTAPRVLALLSRYGEAMALRELGDSQENVARYMRRHNLRFTCPIERIDEGAFDAFGPPQAN